MPATGEKLRAFCSKCKTSKWVSDFDEDNYFRITHSSVCRFCKLAANHESEKSELMKLIVELQKKVYNLENRSCKCTNDSETNIKGKVEKLEQKLSVLNEKVDDNLKKETDFQIVKNKKPTRKINREAPSTKISNRFAALSNHEEESYLIGDSIIRNQIDFFGAKNSTKRRFRCFPGADIKRVTEGIKDIKPKNKKSPIIVHCGTNNVFTNRDYAGTEQIMHDYDSMVKLIKTKTENGLVVGILPRLNQRYITLSKAIGLNNRVKKLCQKMDVNFIDPWDLFFERKEYFAKDGTHLSWMGKSKYGELIHNTLYDILEKKDSSHHSGNEPVKKIKACK